jgi:hypothetical protein
MTALGADLEEGAVELATALGDDFILALTGVREGIGCDASSSSGCARLNFCEDFRGGGLGGVGDNLFFFFCLLGLIESLTVEFDEDDVTDSRKDGRPCTLNPEGPASLLVLPARRRVTGGRLLVGLV